MKTVYLLYVLLLGAGSTVAQSSYESYGLHTTSNGNLWINVPGGRALTEKTLIGPSGYLLEEYLAGDIFTSTKSILSFEKVRFKVETNELEVFSDEKKIFYTPEHIEGFSLKTTTGDRIFIKIWNPIEKSFEFMEVLKSGKNVMLLQDRSVVLKKGDFNPALSVGTKDKYEEKSTFFLGQENQIQVLPTGKNKVLALFGEKASEISSYAKKHKLGYNNTDDVLKLIAYFLDLE